MSAETYSDCAEEFAESLGSDRSSTDLFCILCQAVMEQGKERWLWRASQGDLGPLCEVCFDELHAAEKNSNASDVRDAATGER